MSPMLTDPLPVGRVLSAFTICIVDRDLRPVPSGVTGEIMIGGPCVVSGYLNNADSVKQRFLPDTLFGTSTNIYRTGNRGRLLKDGTLLCSGRLEGDLQIKLRGFRIEVVEFEEAIVRCASGAVSQAIVTLRGTGDGRYLAAHVVFTSELSSDDRGEVMKTLRHAFPLPSYMQPSVFQVLEDAPMTVHFKFNRRALQGLPVNCPADDADETSALTDSESRLSALWRRVLPVQTGGMSADSDFFLMGGNSILLVKLQALMRTELQAAPKLVTLMGAHTLGTMSAAIDENQTCMVINWEAETQIPAWASSAPLSSRAPKTEGINILLTGSQGYLGRHLLAALDSDTGVSQIHCLVRNISNDQNIRLGTKVKARTADLSRTGFGLSEEAFDALADDTDVIVYCAANRNFWERYEALRPDNLDAVKELSRLAVSHSIPIHFLSSGAVAAYDAEGALPPRDGNEGYISTKWATEAFLRCLASAANIPIYIHGPVGVAPDKKLRTDVAPKTEVLSALTVIAQQLGLRPLFDGIQGSVDLVLVDHFVDDLKKSVYSSIAMYTADGNKTVETLKHEGRLRVVVSDFESHVDKNDGFPNLPGIPFLKKSDFKYLMASWDLMMSSEDGNLSTRR